MTNSCWIEVQILHKNMQNYSKILSALICSAFKFVSSHAKLIHITKRFTSNANRMAV